MSDFLLLTLSAAQVIGWIGLIVTSKLEARYEDSVKSKTPQPEIYLINWSDHPRLASLQKWNKNFAATIIFSGIPLLLVGWFLASQEGDCSGRFVDYCNFE